MSWEDIEDAMHFAVTKASGYPPAQVSWSYQNINERSNPHIIITFGGEIVVGIDRIATSQDLGRQAGQEMKQEIRGVREVPFELECFTPDVTGSAAARRVVEIVRTKLRLPDIRYRLRRFGISPFDPGPVNWIPDIPSAGFRGRAACTVRCYVPVSDCEEYTGYIARVTGVIRASGLASTGFGASGIVFDSTVS